MVIVKPNGLPLEQVLVVWVLLVRTRDVLVSVVIQVELLVNIGLGVRLSTVWTVVMVLLCPILYM